MVDFTRKFLMDHGPSQAQKKVWCGNPKHWYSLPGLRSACRCVISKTTLPSASPPSGVRHRKHTVYKSTYLMCKPSAILQVWQLSPITQYNTDPVLNRVKGCVTQPCPKRYLGNERQLLLIFMLKENNLHTDFFPGVVTMLHRKEETGSTR